MISRLEHNKVRVEDLVDETMLLGNTPRPGAADAVLEQFGFLDPLSRIAHGLVEQTVPVGTRSSRSRVDRSGLTLANLAIRKYCPETSGVRASKASVAA